VFRNAVAKTALFIGEINLGAGIPDNRDFKNNLFLLL